MMPIAYNCFLLVITLRFICDERKTIAITKKSQNIMKMIAVIRKHKKVPVSHSVLKDKHKLKSNSCKTALF